VLQAKETRTAPHEDDDSQRGDFMSGDCIAVMLGTQSQRSAKAFAEIKTAGTIAHSDGR
jgi:hypothetical protein